MGAATLYGTLKRLVDAGLDEESDRRPTEDDDQRRRYYRLTGLGAEVCRAEADRLDDLIQHHAEFSHSRGHAAAWGRSGLDLIVTVPRYRLETIMNQHKATNSLHAAVAALAVTGLGAIITVDSYIGGALLVVAAIIAITQRSHLAQAIRVPDTDRRRYRLKMAGFLGFVAIADVAIALVDIGNDESWGKRAFVYGVISYAAAGGSICFLIAGVLTRRTPKTPLPKPAMH